MGVPRHFMYGERNPVVGGVEDAIRAGAADVVEEHGTDIDLDEDAPGWDLYPPGAYADCTRKCALPGSCC